MNHARAHSALFDLVEADLGENLDQWLINRRNAGQTWDEISREISSRSNRSVSRESLRVWWTKATANGHSP